MLGSTGRLGSLEMSCGVSTWWEAEAQESVGICPQGGKVSGGRGPESPFSPTQLQCQAFSTLRPLLEMACSALGSFMGPIFCSERVQGTQTGPLSLSFPHRLSWPAHILGAWAWRLRVCGEENWGEEKAPDGSSLLHLTPLTP